MTRRDLRALHAGVLDRIEDDPTMAAVHLTNHCVQVQ